MKLEKYNTRVYHQKLSLRVVSQITERFNSQDLKKEGNFKAVYFSFHWFNDSWTRGFELVIRGFELVTRGFKLATRGIELATRKVELVTREFRNRNSQIWTRKFQFQLVLLSFQSYKLVTSNS